MKYPIKELQKKAIKDAEGTKKFFDRLKKKRHKDLQDKVLRLHNKAFCEIDCLECANCCSNISPILNNTDIGKLAKATRMSRSAFTNKYIRMDEDGDFIFRETPCPFLLPDNYCMHYNNRPKACKEYPHTDHRNFYQVMKLSEKNAAVCPAVSVIIDNLKQIYR